MRTLPIDVVTANLSEIVDAVAMTHEPVTITRSGKPAATIIATADLETLTETIAWLSDPEHAAEIDEAEAAIEEGRTLSLDEVRAQLGARR